MIRVCRRAGTIGMINWAAGGSIADFFSVFASYLPPLPPDSPPRSVGEYVRELLGPRVASLSTTAGAALVVDHFATPEDMCTYYSANFDPTIATYAHMDGDPVLTAELTETSWRMPGARIVRVPGGPAVCEYDYVRMTARKV
jgi:hypothetical protein